MRGPDTNAAAKPVPRETAQRRAARPFRNSIGYVVAERPGVDSAANSPRLRASVMKSFCQRPRFARQPATTPGRPRSTSRHASPAAHPTRVASGVRAPLLELRGDSVRGARDKMSERFSAFCERVPDLVEHRSSRRTVTRAVSRAGRRAASAAPVY